MSHKYSITVEYNQSEHSVTAENAAEAVSVFEKEFPNYFKNDLTFLIVQKAEGKFKTRFMVTSGFGKASKIEVLGIVS